MASGKPPGWRPLIWLLETRCSEPPRSRRARAVALRRPTATGRPVGIRPRRSVRGAPRSAPRSRRRSAREARRDRGSGAEPRPRRALDRPRLDPLRPRSTSWRARWGSRGLPALIQACSPGESEQRRTGPAGCRRRQGAVGASRLEQARPSSPSSRSTTGYPPVVRTGRQFDVRRYGVVAGVLGEWFSLEQCAQHQNRLVEPLPALLEGDAQGVIVTRR